MLEVALKALITEPELEALMDWLEFEPEVSGVIEGVLEDELAVAPEEIEVGAEAEVVF